MHPWRRQILYRWVLAAVAVLGLGGYLGYTAMESPPRRAPARAPQVKPLRLPSTGDMGALDQVVNVVERLSGQAPSPGQAPDPDLLDAVIVRTAALESKQDAEEEAALPPPALDMIFLGDSSRFASLDGQLYSTGQTTEQGSLVREINWGRVNLVSSRGREQTLYWVDPGRVELTRPDSEDAETPQEKVQEDQAENQSPGRQMEQAAHMDPGDLEIMPETLREAVEKQALEAGEQQRTEIEERQ